MVLIPMLWKLQGLRCSYREIDRNLTVLMKAESTVA